MLHELCITVKMRLLALGHPLDEAQRLATGIVLHLVLLCTLLGYRMVRPDRIRPEERAVPVPACSVSFNSIRGIFPAASGTAGSSSRTLLHH